MEAGGRLPHRTYSEPSIGPTRLGQRPHQREARYSVVPGVVEAAGAAGHRSVLTQEVSTDLRTGAVGAPEEATAWRSPWRSRIIS